jgi:signal transduction histidine kinase
MKRTFVRFVSHEIRTPLNIVVVGLKYVEEKLAAEGLADRCPEVLSTLSDMNESTSVAVSILNDLLAYDKIESGLMVLERIFIDASSFILKSVQLFRVQATHKNIVLNINNRLDEGHHVLHIDESKVFCLLLHKINSIIIRCMLLTYIDGSSIEKHNLKCHQVHSRARHCRLDRLRRGWVRHSGGD